MYNSIRDAVNQFDKKLGVLCRLYNNIQYYNNRTTLELTRYTKSDWKRFGLGKAWKRCGETRKRD